MAMKGEHAEARSRTCANAMCGVSRATRQLEREWGWGRRDSSQSLGTRASNGWRGFPRNRMSRREARRQAGRKVRHSPKPGSPKQRAEAQTAQPVERLRLQVHAKGERFRDLRDGARNSARDITPDNPAHDEQTRHAPTRFRLRSESARDSCRQATRASAHGRSRFRRFSGCDTWQPKRFCGP